jgi:hypothetical protein
MHRKTIASLCCAVWLAACASGPPPPDWQASARSAMERATQAYLVGDARGHALAMAQARSALARTGRPELLARAELVRCAAMVASLVFEPCERFEALRADAAAPERVYADHLAARPLAQEDRARLPAAQQGAAAAVAAGDAASVAAVPSVEDPLSRLIAIAVLFQAGKASPSLIERATETASAQGWRRPLLAWLKVQALHAERAGDAAESQRLQRRIAVTAGEGAK